MHRVVHFSRKESWPEVQFGRDSEETGKEEVWRRSVCTGQLTGAENIKIFVFHVNAGEELIKQNELFSG